MIRHLTIENYKSIQKLELELGRITVLIGANGSGKSNVLEAIALSSAAANDKLDNEFLASRGIRVTDDPRFMRAAFDVENVKRDVQIHVRSDDGRESHFVLDNNDEPYSSWKNLNQDAFLNAIFHRLDGWQKLDQEKRTQLHKAVEAELLEDHGKELRHFLIYSPEYAMLRVFAEEGQIQPLGTRGEGLFKLLRVLGSKHNRSKLAQIKSRMECVDWFEDFRGSF